MKLKKTIWRANTCETAVYILVKNTYDRCNCSCARADNLLLLVKLLLHLLLLLVKLPLLTPDLN